jgi:hypothetical protein
MGEAGQPEPLANSAPEADQQQQQQPQQSAQPPSSDYPSFASSNERGGDVQWDNAQSFADATNQQWGESDYGYDQPAAADNAQAVDGQEHADGIDTSSPKEDNPKPKKRPRVSKPRAPKVEKEEPLDFSQMEFENPDQDPKNGPVFIHPAPGTAQACVRCHRIKRKCDQARPRCAGCSKSDVPCVFELSPATSL